jgi:hypothetical protein
MIEEIVKKHYLQEKPTEAFRIRFKKKHAREIVGCLFKKMDQDERSLPDTIEQILVEYFGLKRKK